MKMFSLRKKIKSGFIEPEEVFMDSLNPLGFDQSRHEGRIERSLSSDLLFSFLLVFFIGSLLLIAGRIGYLQMKEGSRFFSIASSQSLTVSTTPAPRGLIFDMNGAELAGNTSSFDIVFYKSEFLREGGSIPELHKNLSAFLGITADELAADGFFKEDAIIPNEVTLLRNVDTGTVLFIQSHASDLPGIFSEERTRRSYTEGPVFSPLIGYIGSITKEEKATRDDASVGALVGKFGLERQYEPQLRGLAGRKIIQVDARGAVQKIKTIDIPHPGQTLTLAIDGRLQEKAYDVLRTYMRQAGKRAGAVVALDPRDGSVRALVSYPSFENTVFEKKLSEQDFNSIFNNPDKPLFHRAVSGEYPAGSVIKPVIASAALEEEIIDPLKQIFSAGSIKIPNPFKPGEFSVFLDWKALGWMDMRHAIAYSSNVYFYSIGGGYESQQGLGVERMKKYEKLFGLGSVLGIDFPLEGSGFIPDQAWKAEKRPKDPIWRVGDTYNISIGQGDMLVTPLQVASYTSVFANEGTLYTPIIVKKITDPETGEILRDQNSLVIRENFISTSTIRIVREGMRMAVTEGSARSLNAVSVPIAGKTGTAQTGKPFEEHAWFTGFAPYENPELVLTVLVEKGGEGSSISVPIAKDIFDWYFSQEQRAEKSSQEEGFQASFK